MTQHRNIRQALAVVAALAFLTPSASALASVAQIPGGPCTLPGDHGLSERDVYRIEHLTSARTGGLAAAMRSDNAEDRQTVSALYEAGLHPVSSLPEGAYQCRTIKLGGISDLVVYQWFNCEVGAEDGVLMLRKVTGSQNFSGTLEPAGAGFLFKGALTYGYEDAYVRYGEDATRDQVGCLTRDFEDGSNFILELPYPQFESLHDVIVLRKSN